MVTAERLHADPSPPEIVPLAQCAERVLRGEILRLRGVLPALGWLDRFRALTFDCLSALASADVAPRLDREGFETVHRILSGRQLVALQRRLAREFFALRLPVCRSFARDLFDRFESTSTWVPFSDERLLETPLAPLASLRSRLTLAHARYRARDLRARLGGRAR